MARNLSAAEQRQHIAEGDYVWCEECGGSGDIAYFDLGIPLAECHFCDGNGIVFCGDDEPVSAAIEARQMDRRVA